MDLYSNDNDKEYFQQITQKQLKYSRKSFLITFSVIGVFFLLLSLILFLCGIKDEDGFMPSFILGPFGLFWILLGVILYFAIPKQYNYDKYKKRVEKYGALDMYSTYATVQQQKEKIQELEDRICALESKYNIDR